MLGFRLRCTQPRPGDRQLASSRRQLPWPGRLARTHDWSACIVIVTGENRACLSLRRVRSQKSDFYQRRGMGVLTAAHCALLAFFGVGRKSTFRAFEN
jgi:hypothetical protein